MLTPFSPSSVKTGDCAGHGDLRIEEVRLDKMVSSEDVLRFSAKGKRPHSVRRLSQLHVTRLRDTEPSEVRRSKSSSST